MEFKLLTLSEQFIGISADGFDTTTTSNYLHNHKDAWIISTYNSCIGHNDNAEKITEYWFKENDIVGILFNPRTSSLHFNINNQEIKQAYKDERFKMEIFKPVVSIHNYSAKLKL